MTVVASFSSRGPTWYDGQVKPDLVAPGRRQVEAIPASSTLFSQVSVKPLCSGIVESRCYVSLSGTSMASAVATGVVARVIEANRNARGVSPWPWTPSALAPNLVKAILQ